MAKRILIVEDNNSINSMLNDLLSINGYQTIQAYSGTEAIMHFEMQTEIDLVLLDLMIPGQNGKGVLKAIREKSNLPVIALTALGDKENKIRTLQLGANDYITKPFDNDELLVRIEVQFRTTTVSASKDNILSYKDIILDNNSHEVFLGEKRVILSKKEFEILKLLMEHPKRVFTKDNIYEAVWNDVSFADENTINVHISKIRTKLAEINPEQEYIRTVWGVGFKMF